MKDEEFKELRNRLLLGVFVACIVVIPLFIALVTRLEPKDETVKKNIEKRETFFLLIEPNTCSNCKSIKNALKKKEVNYEVLKEKDEEYYEEILSILKLEKSMINSPTLIYILKGDYIDRLNNIKEIKQVNKFVTNMVERW